MLAAWEGSGKAWRRTLLIAILVFGGSAAAWLGVRAYRVAQPENLVRQAREYLAHGDETRAILAARRALQIDPASLSASRLMADACEQLGGPETVAWRRRVVQLSPVSPEAILQWADSALAFGDLLSAQQALQKIPLADRGSAYYASAGALAAARGDFKPAAAHYREAMELSPGDEAHQLHYATAALQSKNAGIHEEAVAILSRLTENPKLRMDSLRALLRDAAGQEEWLEALRYAARLNDDPDATFGDAILHLEVLRLIGSADFGAHLQELQSDAEEDPQLAGALIAWMREVSMAPEAIGWSSNLAVEVIASAEAGPQLAQCYIDIKDWALLEAFAEKGDWRETEYLRELFLALALKKQGHGIPARTHFASAVNAAVRQPHAPRRSLAQLIASWGWQDELRDFLLAVADDPRDSRWALHLLFQHYTSLGDTSGLRTLAARMMELDPADDLAKNNWAMYSLLLNQDLDAAAGIAEQLYGKEPANHVFASTQAYALHVSGRSDEALEIMRSIPEARLQEPATAAYFGILLLANKAPEEAAEYLHLSQSARLLPEEKAFVTMAVQKTGGSRGQKERQGHPFPAAKVLRE